MGEIYIHATSLWAMRTSLWVMSGDGIKATDIQDEFKCCNVYAKEKCRNCFARFYCSGGCAANSYNFHGTITDAYDLGCELQKKRIECAIMIKAAEADMQMMHNNLNLSRETDSGICDPCANIFAICIPIWMVAK